MEYLALKKKEILPHVTTWMNIEGITLSEINQPEGPNLHDSNCMRYLKQPTNKSEEWSGGCQGFGVEEMGSC